VFTIVPSVWNSTSPVAFRNAAPAPGAEVVSALEHRGVDFQVLAAEAGQPDADPFDLLCHVAYNAPLLTRRQRADKLRKAKPDFFDRYGPDTRAVLDAILDKTAASSGRRPSRCRTCSAR
jgi:type I restriction enzyme R subunit